MKQLLIIAIVLLASSKNNLPGQNLSSSMTYSTYYGDNGTDYADVVTVYREGEKYLGCHSNSSDLPSANQYPYTQGGNMDAFLQTYCRKQIRTGS